MSRVTVEMPGWARELARWEVQAGEQHGDPGEAIEVDVGTVCVAVDAYVTRASTRLAGRLELDLEIGHNSDVVLTAPVDALRAVAFGLLVARGPLAL